MSKIESRLVASLVSLAVVAGCSAATRNFKEGKTIEEQGDAYGAGLKYLAALDLEPDHEDAQQAIVAISQRAYGQKLDVAHDYENSKNYAAAITEYRELGEFIGRLKQRNAIQFAGIDTRAKVDELQSAGAEEKYAAGEAALARKDWPNAVSSYEAATKFKAGYKDTGDKIGQAHYAWAEAELAARRSRAAAEHFMSAQKSAGSGFKDASTRASVIYAALGRYFLGKDICRQAVKDLRIAKDTGGGPDVANDLARAEECAITGVAVLPLENPTGRNLAGMALGDTLSESIGAAVRTRASEFVKLIERSALDQILAEQKLTAGGIASGQASKIRGVRYLVLGKLTQVKVDAPAIAEAVQSVRVEAPYECQTGTAKDGTPITGVCWSPMMLGFKVHTGKIDLRVAGSLKVVDTKSGEQMVTVPLESSQADSVKWASDFVDAKTQEMVDIGRLRGVPRELESLASARQQLADESQLTQKVISALTEVAAKAVVGAVDVDRPASDPSELKI